MTSNGRIFTKSSKIVSLTLTMVVKLMHFGSCHTSIFSNDGGEINAFLNLEPHIRYNTSPEPCISGTHVRNSGLDSSPTPYIIGRQHSFLLGSPLYAEIFFNWVSISLLIFKTFRYKVFICYLSHITTNFS